MNIEREIYFQQVERQRQIEEGAKQQQWVALFTPERHSRNWASHLSALWQNGWRIFRGRVTRSQTPCPDMLPC